VTRFWIGPKFIYDQLQVMPSSTLKTLHLYKFLFWGTAIKCSDDKKNKNACYGGQTEFGIDSNLYYIPLHNRTNTYEKFKEIQSGSFEG